MSTPGKLIVLGGAYGDVVEAMKDFDDLHAAWSRDEIGDYDAGIVTKEPSGMLILSNGDSTGHFKGATSGIIVGAVLGVVFPPSMLGLAALGAAGGAALGGMKKHIGRGDIKSLGELLNPGESGILIVTERVADKTRDALLSRASRKKDIEVEGDAEAIKAAVREAAG